MFTFYGLKSKTFARRLKIRFASSVTGSGFRCKLDGKPFKSCRPFATKRLAFGPHEFSAIATSAAGQAGPVASKKFWVLRHHRARHR